MKRNIWVVWIGWFLYWVLISGCSHVVLFDPKGPIGEGERFVVIAAIVLMLIVIIPVFVMAFLFPRKYRASNPRATYMPKWSYSTGIDLAMWLVPIAIVGALGTLAWTRTHSLDPYRPIASGAKPVRIEAVSLDWKWLFIYPDHNIAALNQIVFPANVPINFRITSDTVVASFFIPQLGSQIYAMAGAETRLHLLADAPGAYSGQNQQFSGRGYADMHFDAIATSPEEFRAWVQKARQSVEKLDLPRYEELARPSVGHPVAYFSAVTPALFETIMAKYNPRKEKNTGTLSGESGSTQIESDSPEGK